MGGDILIFVTVGTHEQQFNRLISKIDNFAKNSNMDAFAQIGYSSYVPKYIKFAHMIGYEQMEKYESNSDIIITHGGPGSIFGAINKGKVPIVVPRNPKFNEHVDEHQIKFAERLEAANKIIAVYDINDLDFYIINYRSIIKKMNLNKQNNDEFFKNKFEEFLKRIGGK